MGSEQFFMGSKEELNQIEFLKLVDEEEEDRISVLPDCLLIEILSRLPSTKHAIRTGILAKRWKQLWTSVTTLIFTYSSYLPIKWRPNVYMNSNFVSFVDKTLTQRHQLKLNKFVLHTDYDSRFDSRFNKWICYAIRCNVQDLSIKLWHTKIKAAFLLDQLIFINSCFTDLTLERCVLNPTRAISWKNLRNLCIYYGKLNEDLIENILSGCPLSKTLELDACYGYKRLEITSKSVENLVFSGYIDPEHGYNLDDIIEINAPNILSLTIRNPLMLWKLLLVNVSSLLKANLDYYKIGINEGTRKEAEEEMLKGFILSLLHVTELKIGSFCSKVVSRLEAKGFVFPSNIKFPDVTFDSD
ncbi:hypothetical protein LXL04_027355 [Taraxacum kok-saghyz]